MRIKATFSVFQRKLPSGKGVFYYQCYDEKGNRQWAKSTGLSKKTEAVAYCNKLFRDGLLIPEQKALTFAEFSKGWWNIETCQYLKWRQLHEPITQSTLLMHQGNFKHHISDYFAKYRLDEITPEVIECWLVFMSEKGSLKKSKDEKNKKCLKANTINLVFGTLKLMLAEAVRKKIIKNNPCLQVKDLKEEESIRIILSLDEAYKMFPADWSSVWYNPIVYKAHKLAACTGLRIGELRGLRGECIFSDYIFVSGQYTRFGYVDHTKTKEKRNIPISPVIRQELNELLEINGNGHVFSDDGGETPITTDQINRGFNRALENIGISYAEKMKRNLSFHSWRHFLNTLLLMSNVTDSKVQSITGHKTNGMTKHYTHFDTRKFTEVIDIQNNLLTFNEIKNDNQNNITDVNKIDVKIIA